MLENKNLQNHCEDESNSADGFANQSVKEEISDNDLATIIKFIQMEAPLGIINEYYKVSNEQLVKRLVNYIITCTDYKDPFSPASLDNKEKIKDLYVPSCVVDASGSGDTVQYVPVHSARSDKPCAEVMTDSSEKVDNDCLANYKRRRQDMMEKSFFSAYQFPDAIIIKVCRLLEKRVPRRQICNVLGVSSGTFNKYFARKEYEYDLHAGIIDEYLQCYSIYEIVCKYELNCYGVYKALVDSGVFDCTRTMEHKVVIEDKVYNHYDVALVEYRLGGSIESICRRYGISESVFKERLETKGIKGVIQD